MRLLLSLDVNVPEVKVSPSSSILKGNEITLSCHTEGTLPITYTWMKNGKTLSVSGSTLLLTKTTYESSGQYVCYVENSGGKKHSSSQQVLVLGLCILPSHLTIFNKIPAINNKIMNI